MNRKKPTTTVTPKVRCAIYTRKSTDEGLSSVVVSTQGRKRTQSL